MKTRYSGIYTVCIFLLLLVSAAANASTNTKATNRTTGAKDTVSTKQLILRMRSDLDNGRYLRLRSMLTEVRSRGAEDRLSAKLKLGIYYHTGNTPGVRATMKAHPELATTPGKHRMILALQSFDDGDYSSFYRHLAASYVSNQQLQDRLFFSAVLALTEKSYKKALRIINKITDEKWRNLSLRLSAYIHIRNENYEEAYRQTKAIFAARVFLPAPAIHILYQLAYKTGSGTEAVYWSSQLLKKNPRLKKNPVFINNRCMALSMKLQQNQKPSLRVPLIRELLETVNKLLQVKRDANSLHTASIAYEKAGILQKAVEMIRLCRALKPREKSYLLRQKKLEKALKAMIRKSGRKQ